MGLFDRFRKRVHEVAEETDGDALSVDATSEEAQTLLEQPDEQSSDTIQDDDWDDVDAEPTHVLHQRTKMTTGTHGMTTNRSCPSPHQEGAETPRATREGAQKARGEGQEGHEKARRSRCGTSARLQS